MPIYSPIIVLIVDKVYQNVCHVRPWGVASVLVVISTRNANIFEIVQIVGKVFQNVDHVRPRGVVSVLVVISTRNANICEIVLIVDETFRNVYHVCPRGVVSVLLVITPKNPKVYETVLNHSCLTLIVQIFTEAMGFTYSFTTLCHTCTFLTFVKNVKNCLRM